MKILHLTLKKKWFDMVASGEKKAEYRTGSYWFKRLVVLKNKQVFLKHDWDRVQFRNGYNKDSPVVTVEFKSLGIGEGKPEWGAKKGVRYIVIELGEIIKT